MLYVLFHGQVRLSALMEIFRIETAGFVFLRDRAILKSHWPVYFSECVLSISICDSYLHMLSCILSFGTRLCIQHLQACPNRPRRNHTIPVIG